MGEKGCGDDDGLGLSLRLGCAVETHQPNLHLNLMHSPPSLSMMHHHHLQHHKSSIWNETFQSYDRSPELSRDETRSFMRGGIDVNRRPSMVECDDEAVVSSPNSTISSISGKRSERDQGNGDDTEAERASCSRGLSDDEDGGGGDGDGDAARKKLRLSKDQSAVLEDTFKEHSTLNPKQKLALAKQLNLRPRQVEVWFQNRRARTKLKQTEVDCEYLKRCCDNLTEENRRLQKEVQELRALKLSPQMYMHMNPPTTLTMCPSCERVAVSSSSSSAAAAAAVGDTRHHRHPVGPHHQRPVPINPWATTPIQRRP